MNHTGVHSVGRPLQALTKVEFGADIPEHFTISEVTIPLMTAGSESFSACSDVVVIGSGPNGLAAAITLAQAGHAVRVLEAEPGIGGGTQSAEVTLPGFIHDLCSAVHPLAVASPFFSSLPLRQYGLEWQHPPVPLAHPLDDGSAVLLERSLEGTAQGLGADAAAYRNLMAPLRERWSDLLGEVLRPPHFPEHPLLAARFACQALRSAEALGRSCFREQRARALFAGLAAHSTLPLNRPGTAAVALVLAGAAHAVGWPFPRGGAQRIADSLAMHLESLGGRIQPGVRIVSLDQLPRAKAILCDVAPRQLARMAENRLPEAYRRKLLGYRHGPGAFKVDWALSAPIPWRAPECARAGTVHLGGTMEEISAAERAVWEGTPADRPFVLLAQPSRFDPARAPAGRHTAWAYCHVPHGSGCDMLEKIEDQIERFAPGFRSLVLARSVRSPAVLEQHNANLIGGDISGGVQDLRQMVCRPTWRWYATPVPRLFLCSSSTPPGGGVHGMCGYNAALAAIRQLGN
jgi:phytoene dehydrogenase-like protein